MGSGTMTALHTRAGQLAVAAALLAVGVGAGATAVVVSSPGTAEVADTSTITTETTGPVMTTAPADIPPATETVPPPAPATTVKAVPEQPVVIAPVVPDAPTEVAVEAGPEYDPAAPFTDAAGNTYLPAPAPPVQPMPGEPGHPDYQPPKGVDEPAG
jgi:hypothetical protein